MNLCAGHFNPGVLLILYKPKLVYMTKNKISSFS